MRVWTMAVILGMERRKEVEWREFDDERENEGSKNNWDSDPGWKNNGTILSNIFGRYMLLYSSSS